MAPRSSWPGRYFDGETPVPRAAMVVPGPLSLAIHLDDGQALHWEYGQIRQVQGAYAGEPVRLEHGEPLPRAVVIAEPDFLVALARASRGARFQRPVQPRARVAQVVGLGVGVLVLLGLSFGYLLPASAGAVADVLPVAWETWLGEQARPQLARGARPPGADAAGRAMQTLLARLDEAARPHPYTFRLLLVERPTVNAMALPGGTLIFHTELLRQAASADEVAGVMAHEMVHVLHHHATRALVRQAGAGLLIGALSGGMDQGGQAVRSLASLGMLQYDRDAELEADADGWRLVARAGFDPRDMVRFFRQLDEAPGALAYLSDHPGNAARIRQLEALPVPPGPRHPGPPVAWDEVVRSLAR